ACLRFAPVAARQPLANARLRADARARDGGIPKKLAAGVMVDQATASPYRTAPEGSSFISRTAPPQRSATSQPMSTAGAAPGRKVPSLSSRLPINLQINGQTCHLNSQSDRWPSPASPDAYDDLGILRVL